MLFPQIVNILFTFMARYAKMSLKKAKIVNLASISFNVFKPIIMILVVVIRASIVVVFPGNLTNSLLHPKRYCYFSTKRQGLTLPEYLAILKGLSYIFLLKLHTFLFFHAYMMRVMGLPNVYLPETNPSDM